MVEKVPTIAKIKKKYENAIFSTQRAYSNRHKEDTAGAVRYEKGKIVEEMTKDLIIIAWSELGKDLNKLQFNRKKIKVRFNPSDIDYYGLSQDIHVFIDKDFRISIECKSYTEVAMYKRILTDSFLLKKSIPSIRAFFVVQLENFMGGDYGKRIEATGSKSVRALNKFFPGISIKVLTLVDGDRDINKPLHNPKYYKPLNKKRLRYAINEFKKALS